MKKITRQEAKQLDKNKYFTGKPCKHGHVAARFVRSGGCVECFRRTQRERARRLRAANPDRMAAFAGRSNAHARYPGCVPPDFNLEDTIPFYAEARRLTRETGIRHEVDHIKALILGGKHIASNLQVITVTANQKKATAEKAHLKK